MVLEELLKIFLGHLAIWLRESKKQFGPEKELADHAAELSIVIVTRMESGDEEVRTGEDEEKEATDIPSSHGSLQRGYEGWSGEKMSPGGRDRYSRIWGGHKASAKTIRSIYRGL
jgi:hypothetical protein